MPIKKLLLSILVTFSFFLLFTYKTQALTFHRDEFGGLSVYKGLVLGKQDNRGNSNSSSKRSANNPSQEKKEEVLIKKYSVNEKKEVQVSTTNENKIQAKVKTKNASFDSQIQTMEETETVEAERIRLRVDKPVDEFEEDSDIEDEDLDEDLDEEEIDLESDGDQLKIKTKGITANTGAQFVLDSETGLVTVVTPSGNEHQLKHFPDEAIRTMLAKGKMIDSSLREVGMPEPDDDDATESADISTSSAQALVYSPKPEDYQLELNENEEGEMIYQASIEIQRRFLGVLPWQQTQEIQMNDSTGEVEVIQPESFFQRLLTSLSSF